MQILFQLNKKTCKFMSKTKNKQKFDFIIFKVLRKMWKDLQVLLNTSKYFVLLESQKNKNCFTRKCLLQILYISKYMTGQNFLYKMVC